MIAKGKLIPKVRAKKPKRIWDNYIVVGEVQKSDRLKFVLAAAVRDGVKYINIREFYMKKSEEEWMPGRDGITVPIVIPINKGENLLQPAQAFESVFYDTVRVLTDIALYDEDNAIFRKEKKE
jgi:hypothetical protein